MKKKNSAGKVRSALSCFLAVLLFVSLFAEVPFTAAAAEGTSENASAEESADSWRYSNGSLIDDPVTDSEASSLSALSSSTTSVYPTWTADNGLTSYSLVTKTTTDDETTTTTETVSVDGAVRVGVDVSKWNGEIDWEKVAASGVTFAIIRCGYGSDYEDQDDEYFLANVEGALAAGLSIGIYLYSYATKATGSAPSAESEAEHVLRLLGEAGLEPEDLDLPIFYDLEDSSQTGLGAETLGDMAEAFCGALQKEGYAVGIYANLYWWTTYLTDEAFDNDIWYKWVARYPTSTSTADCGVEDADLWQFTSRGTVDGIDGVVDINFDYQGEGAYPATVPEKMVLSSVTLDSSNTSAVLTWEALSLADGYRIYRSTDGGSYERMETITDITTTTWTDTTLEPGTTYKYKIGAYLIADDGTFNFGSCSSPVYVTTKPEKVASLSVTLDSSETSATVSWSAVSKGTGYRVYRSVDGGEYVKVATITSISTTTWSDTSIEPGTVYTYKVRAYSTDNNGDKVFGSYSSAAAVTTKPSKMTLLSVTLDSTFSTATVKWTTLSYADGYQIYRAEGDGSYELVKTIKSGSTKSWKDTTVELGVTYKYKIRAYVMDDSNSEVYGSFSSSKSVTTRPDTVTITSASRTSSGYVTVKWEKVSNATGYKIYRSTNGGSYELVKTITSNTTVKWTDKTVSTGTVYKYKIKAYYKSGSTTVKSASYSNAKKVITRPKTVTISSATKTSAGNITVKWKKVSNATGYIIYRSTNGGSYKKVKTIKSNSTVKWTDTSVSAGKVYRYKIKAYTSSGSTTVKSASYSSVKKVTAKPGKVTITSVTSTKSKTATVKWKKVSGATGYQIAYRIKGSSEWHYTTVTKNSKKFTSMKNKNYYIKVRAYTTYKGTKYYGSWSTETVMKVK